MFFSIVCNGQTWPVLCWVSTVLLSKSRSSSIQQMLYQGKPAIFSTLIWFSEGLFGVNFWFPCLIMCIKLLLQVFLHNKDPKQPFFWGFPHILLVHLLLHYQGMRIKVMCLSNMNGSRWISCTSCLTPTKWLFLLRVAVYWGSVHTKLMLVGWSTDRHLMFCRWHQGVTTLYLSPLSTQLVWPRLTILVHF